MTRPGDTVICAVSGGKDSMALLHLLLELRAELEISVAAAHFDHQLRGSESRRDRDFVQKHCEKLGVPLFLGEGDVARYAGEEGLGLEEAARTLRYRFFDALPSQARIATAHTAQDNLETMLLRLLRGCGLHGLSGIPPVRGRFIRPLLLTEETEIETYLLAHSIPHVEDSSNGSDEFLRNRLRRQVLPPLLAENPNLSRSASRLCLLLGQEDQILAKMAEEKLAALLEGGMLSCEGLLELPEAMALRILALFLKDVPGLSQVHLETARALCGNPKPSARLSLPGGFQLRRVYGRLALEKETAPPSPPPEVSISPGKTVIFGPFLVSCRSGPAPEQRENGLLALSAEKVRPPLTLRPRRPGDQIVLSAGSKKLSRWMIDEKIPAMLRDHLPVAARDGEVLALLPLRAAEPYRAQPGEEALLLEIKEKEDAVWKKTLPM